ncbi:MAG TPA: sodium/substrate symporter small subunit [Salinivirga sp.]|uniref:sodium/substrate symporter small subunit n=1 Tax=Salinivirga sp. TaxID=1970192 RepID=UPI002B4A8372|nr:sodium/substrate symporter small subunit [Salinivirga sp.]HKK60734.1 sodium/substrate symporter small subunit [Salinivirga sp.]
MNENNQFHISFFRPTTERARKNRNKVVWLLAIWAIGVFGFQFLLRALEEPTPEPVLTEFNEVWDNVKSDNANKHELQTFAKSALQVTGKVFIKPEHRNALDNGITWATMKLADSAQKIAISQALIDFEKAAKDLEVLSDENYQTARNNLAALARVPLGLKSNELLTNFLPLELDSKMAGSFTDENKKIVAKAMPLYTIHNQSVLTDTKFLGFPFHYFYTSVFLLILFIVICWFYSFTTDKINKKLKISE